jgi:hypothetical protein
MRWSAVELNEIDPAAMLAHGSPPRHLIGDLRPGTQHIGLSHDLEGDVQNCSSARAGVCQRKLGQGERMCGDWLLTEKGQIHLVERFGERLHRAAPTDDGSSYRSCRTRSDIPVHRSKPRPGRASPIAESFSRYLVRRRHSCDHRESGEVASDPLRVCGRHRQW